MRIQLVRPLVLCAVLTLPLACNGDDNKTDADTNAATESAEQGCTPGELNCECNADQCLGDLQCVEGMCVNACVPGELGCECNAGLCLGGLECVGDICTDPNCTPGELACECNNGQCLGELECVGNVCLEGSGDGDGDSTGDGDGDPTGDGDGDPTGDGDGDPTGDGDGDPQCPNANEMMCDGECIDVMDNDDNCGGCGNVCKTHPGDPNSLGHCVEGACTQTWSDCISMDLAPISCDEVCQMEGSVCVDQGCNGWTLIYSDNLEICNSGTDVGHSPLDCDVNVPWQGSYIGCCCL